MPPGLSNFQEYRIARALPQIRIGLLLSTVIYLLFGFLDPLLVDNPSDMLFVRAAVIAPIFLLALAATYHPQMLDFYPYVASFAVFTGVLGIFLLLWIGGEGLFRYYFPAASLTLLFGVVLARLQIKPVMFLGTITWLMFLCLHLWLVPQPLESTLNDLSYYAVTAILASYIAYDLTQVDRQRFRQQRRLQEKVDLDPLTHIYNRRYLFEYGNQAFEQAGENDEALSVMMMDLDWFKSVNDRFGHTVGDRVLQEFVTVLKKQLRPNDQFGRYGGEEFMLILPNTTLSDAKTLAQRLLETVRQHPFQTESGGIELTISIGIATASGDQPQFAELVRLADRALYQAKHDGRDRAHASND